MQLLIDGKAKDLILEKLTDSKKSTKRLRYNSTLQNPKCPTANWKISFIMLSDLNISSIPKLKTDKHSSTHL